jgi:hypothetical protein
MVDSNLLMPNGTKVKVLNSDSKNNEGTIAGYLYSEHRYLILFKDNSASMVKPSDIEKI